MLSGSNWPALLRLRAPVAAQQMVRCHCFGLARGSGKAGGGSHDGAGGAAGAAGAQQQAGAACAPPPTAAAPTSAPKLPRTELPLQQTPLAATSTGQGGKKQPRSSGKAAPPLRVMTFNILADGLAQHGDFVACPPEVLAWEYRFPRIIQVNSQVVALGAACLATDCSCCRRLAWMPRSSSLCWRPPALATHATCDAPKHQQEVKEAQCDIVCLQEANHYGKRWFDQP